MTRSDTKQSAPTGKGRAQIEAATATSEHNSTTLRPDCQAPCAVLQPALVTCASRCCDPRYLVLLARLTALAARWAW